ncbi:Type-1 restriction enzyme EcoKI specificity protein [termite gut metagenome]|uniref:Type-1 restriction enzyme EcoKI specificity protein n=1 Tax=termite gut metagenome TaxID=433724 RepID=A0A5J4QAN5_9ZZZZ
MLSKYKYLNKNTKGIGIPHINSLLLDELKLALPPLNEQHKIVEKIEELFSEIEYVEKNLIDINKRLNIYWQVILEDAFDQRLPKENLSSYTTFIGAGSTPKGGRSIYVKNGIPFIRSQNVLCNSLNLDDVVYITNEINEKMSRTKIQTNDVLLNITGASIGRCAYIPDNVNQANVNQHVCIIRTTSELSHKYLTLYLNTLRIQRLIQKWSSGATREALTLSQINNIPIPICPLTEQELIVAELESQYTILENVKETINKKLDQIGILKQSILSKAFTGELVPQNPSDESASELLKKIKDERTSFLQNKTTVRKIKTKIIKMERTKSVLELLQETQNPVLAKELWQQSKHAENIEDFYAELKSISNLIEQTKSKTQISLSLKR